MKEKKVDVKEESPDSEELELVYQLEWNLKQSHTSMCIPNYHHY